MPQISGFDLVEVIKNFDFLDNAIFMALTTEGAKDKEELIKNAGFSGWIMKPFKTEILKKAIEKILKL
jgi:CheY-like chemotaxis protein